MQVIITYKGMLTSKSLICLVVMFNLQLVEATVVEPTIQKANQTLSFFIRNLFFSIMQIHVLIQCILEQLFYAKLCQEFISHSHKSVNSRIQKSPSLFIPSSVVVRVKEVALEILIISV
jgi:hypothetical protein